MKRYIQSSIGFVAEPTIVNIELYDGKNRNDICCPGTFAMTAYDDRGDEIWIGVGDGDLNNYYLESALEGYIYSNQSLYEVLVHFTDRYNVSFEYVKDIFKFARKYTRR